MSEFQSEAYHPKKINTIVEPIVNLTAGKAHVLCISDACTVYSWGYNNFGQLAEDPNITQEVILPKILKFFVGKNALQAYAGDFSSAAVTKSNILYVWGQV